jgi:hypothetical protein
MGLLMLEELLFSLLDRYNEKTIGADRIPRIVLIVPVGERRKELVGHKSRSFRDIERNFCRIVAVCAEWTRSNFPNNGAKAIRLF